MRILFLTLGAPYPPDRGARIRDYHVIREVARQHRVSVVSLLYPGESNDSLEPLAEFCASAEAVALPARSPAEALLHAARTWRGRPLATLPFFHRAAADCLRRVAEREQVDTVQIEHSFLAPYRDALPARLRPRAVLSLHNVGAEQYRRMLNLRLTPARRASYLAKSVLMRGWESRHAARFARTLAVSEADASLMWRAHPRVACRVIPNGVDARALQPLPDPGGATLLFVGTLGYPPNADAVTYFVEHVLPRVRQRVPEARLVAVGHAPPPQVRRLAQRGQLALVESAPEVVPHYQGAVAAVVPLRAGSGTRLKILEAMALGRPVVSTTLGCEGLELTDGEHLLVADDPQAFADATLRLLLQPALRARITRSARARVQSRYHWSTIGRQVAAVHQEIAADARQPSDAVSAPA